MDECDEGLIRFLMRDRHGTPFEHNAFRFHVRCPIFVAREWFRHRVGSFNEFSLRYAKATDDFYVPEADDVRTQVGKPGAYTFEPVDAELAEHTREELAGRLRPGLRDLRAAGRGRASPARSPGPCCRSGPTPSSTGRSTPGLADELRLAAELRVCPVRDPASTPRRSRASSTVMPVTHAAFVDQGRTAPSESLLEEWRWCRSFRIFVRKVLARRRYTGDGRSAENKQTARPSNPKKEHMTKIQPPWSPWRPRRAGAARPTTCSTRSMPSSRRTTSTCRRSRLSPPTRCSCS